MREKSKKQLPLTHLAADHAQDRELEAISRILDTESTGARRAFWITDNGSSHRGQRAIKRFKNWYPNTVLVHTPVHASWLIQVEIYFSILQRKVLTPNDFDGLEQLERTILDFQAIYEKSAKPFVWKFSREDLKNVLAKFNSVDFQ